MSQTYNTTIANAILDSLDTHFPEGSILELRSGGAPGPNNAASGTLIASITLPASPWAASASGSKAKSGTWSDSSANNPGTLAHFRLKNAGDTLRHEGTITITGGGGDMTVDNTVVELAQVVTVTAFTRTLPIA